LALWTRIAGRDSKVTVLSIYGRQRSSVIFRSKLDHGMNMDFVPHGLFDLEDLG
jgi:hypothetical protein